MNKKYFEAREIIDRAKRDLKTILDQAPSKAEDDSQAYSNLENIIDKLEDTKDFLNYLSAEVKEGILKLDPIVDKFYIEYDDGETSNILSCGNSLELFYDDEWFYGRVEGRSKQYTTTFQNEYYFYGADKPALYVGMRVRKRQN